MDDVPGKETRKIIAEKYGTWVREQLELRGWSQADLARRAGLKRATIGQIVHGEATQPTAWQIASIASALGVQPNDIFAAMGLMQMQEQSSSLPGLEVYLRARGQLSEETVRHLTALITSMELQQRALLDARSEERDPQEKDEQGEEFGGSGRA